MNKGPEVSPAVAGVIVVIVLIVAGALVYRATGARGRAEIPPEQAAKIRQSLTGGPRGVSGPPPFVMNGRPAGK